MIRFSKERVLLLHGYMVEDTGGSADVRDMALLESALESVYATFDGQELYPSKEEKGARLCYNLVTSHPFVDGNKRIGIYVMMAFLQTNGIQIASTIEETISIGMLLATGKLKYPELLAWVRDHSRA